MQHGHTYVSVLQHEMVMVSLQGLHGGAKAWLWRRNRCEIKRGVCAETLLTISQRTNNAAMSDTSLHAAAWHGHGEFAEPAWRAKGRVLAGAIAARTSACECRDSASDHSKHTRCSMATHMCLFFSMKWSW